MTYGIQIENQSGTLVLSSNAMVYRYLGLATLISAGSKTAGLHTPYTYRLTMPNATAVPVVALAVSSTSVGSLFDVRRTPADGTNTQWDVLVYSCLLAGCTEQATLAMSAPTVHVFSPPVLGAGSYGLQMFNAAGVLTSDFSYPPLWVRQIISFAPLSGGYTAGFPGVWTNQASLEGDSMAWDNSGYSSLAVIGSASGFGQEVFGSTGETGNEWSWGWNLSGAQLRRRRFWSLNPRTETAFDPAYDDMYFSLDGTKAALLNEATFI